MAEPTTYRVGIDVGLNSVGFAAVEVDDEGVPIGFLSLLSYVHDSGVDPQHHKQAQTRLEVSGVARRTRRLILRRRKRLKALDREITDLGWPIIDLEDVEDPWYPWLVRAQLATAPINSLTERNAMLSVAVRHMARHRGWRNPWTGIVSLLAVNEPSKFLVDFRDRVVKSGVLLPSQDLTPAQLVIAAKRGPNLKLRGDSGLLGGTLHQSDNVRELKRIAAVQGLDDATFKILVNAVFDAKSPKGAAASRAGHDPLPGQENLVRAPKASLAFQQYRIVTLVANLRVKDTQSGRDRILSVAERNLVCDLLTNWTGPDDPAWEDVAGALQIPRQALRGTATPTADGDRAAARPPVNLTNRDMLKAKPKALATWWAGATTVEREAMVEALSNSGVLEEDSPGGAAVAEFLEDLGEDDLARLDSVHLAAGRAAYSVDSLQRLTARMLESTDDLHAARMAVFRVPTDWNPPAERIGAPVGNPAVDRVLKIVARWLLAAESSWGKPQSINVEHVRSGLMSEAAARELERANERRYKAAQEAMADLRRAQGIVGEIKRSDIRRLQAITRQNGQCLYCGEPINHVTAEMDHILPRAGTGSTNTRDNLVAVCKACNAEKSNIPFAIWAAKTKRQVTVKAAIERVNHWLSDPGATAVDHRKLQKSVIGRLKRDDSDPEIDNRSIESVAWMANELHLRIRQHFTGTDVAVFRGWLTSEARKASGIEKRVPFIGGNGKTRLDRRHHAVDAATIALLTQSIATTLVVRDNLRQAEQFTGKANDWRLYSGAAEGDRALWAAWRRDMGVLCELIAEAFTLDRVPVTESLRLRLGNSKAHDDKIRALDRSLSVSDAISETMLNRSASPAQWTALTRLPDYVPGEGLPADPIRTVRVNDRILTPEDRLEFFGSDAAAIKVRGGYAEIGGTIHHARLYRIETGRKSFYAMMRVFQVDLLAHARGDLFAVEPGQASISFRAAERRLRDAIRNGHAKYLGWLVVGDEIVIDPKPFTSGQIGDFLREYPGQERWRLDGFFSPTRLRLRPRVLALEGIANQDEAPDSVVKILGVPGWRPSTDVLFGKGNASTIRRNVLGFPRLSTNSSLPICWSPSEMR